MGDSEQSIQQTVAKIAAVADDLPTVTIIHHLPRDFSVEYMSRAGLALLGTTLDELRRLGPAYHDRYFNPRDAEWYVPRIRALLERNQVGETFTFFQQVRSSPELYLSINTVDSHKKNLKSKLGIRDTAELIRFARVFDLS